MLSSTLDTEDMSNAFSLTTCGSSSLWSRENFDSYETNNSVRGRPFESYTSGGSRADPERFQSSPRGVFGTHFLSGFTDRLSSFSSPACEREEWDRPAPFPDHDRGDDDSSYADLTSSSSSLFSSPPHTKQAPIGSRGRPSPLYLRGQPGGRCPDVRALAACGAVGRAPKAPPPKPAPLCAIGQQSLALRGMKRKMMAPTLSTAMAKKLKVVRPISITRTELGHSVTKVSFDSKAKHTGQETKMTPEREGQGATDFRREKQRRRRWKNIEKYGDLYRLVFTCALCKFRTFEDKDIERHFGSALHHETLDHIRREAKYDERVISFLHESMLSKFRKTVSRKRRSCPEQTTEETFKEAMEGVTEDDYMRKIEMVHCAACDTYSPAVFTSVQQHRRSVSHLQNKEVYKEQQKRDSVLTATSIFNGPSVKARYERYIKGENPFDSHVREEQLIGGQSESDQIDGRLDQLQDGSTAHETCVEND